MSYASSERDFYQRHYAGELKVAHDIDLRTVAAESFAPGKRYSLILDELETTRTYGTVVEIGCASGECLRYLAGRYRFRETIGVDIAFPDDMSTNHGGIRFVQSNSNNRLPFDDGSIDVYIAMMVIEHLFDPFHAFAEIKRVLSRDGVAFVNLPLVTSIRNRLRLLRGKVPVTSVAVDRWFDDREWDGNHLHYFSVETIRRLASANGLAVGRISGVGSQHKLKSAMPSLLASELSFTLRHAG